MKTITLAALLFLAHLYTFAQTTCRPQISMVDYGYHDDNSSNPHMETIRQVRPDILIDNTPGGLYHSPTLPSAYIAYGIHVYSYIAGGYEGTKHHNDTDNIDLNLGRITAIAGDSAEGVFLDEVSHHPDANGKAYINAMYEKAHEMHLKIILNPGYYNFDTFLVSHSDYIVTDEQYDGHRKPTTSELFDLSKIIVLNDSVPDADSAAKVTDGARSNGFGHSYACTKYIEIPSWINDYMSLIDHPTPTPAISKQGSTLHSNAPYGNQWYTTSTGAIAGATGQDFTPAAQGSYYDIVTTAGCSSAASDTITTGTLATLWITPLSAVQSGHTIVLHWQTAADIHATRYTIERSISANNFKPIGVQNAGNGVSDWTDLQPASGWNYYRVKLPGANGTSIYSNIKAVHFSTAQTISIYPNPVTGNSFTVQLGGSLPQPLGYTLTDISGKPVASGALHQPVQNINVGVLAKGYYLLQLASGEKAMLFIIK